FDAFTRDRAGKHLHFLIINCHASHISYQFCKYAVENNIHLLSYPPHSTHLLQPLNVGLFGPLQYFYGKAADDYVRNSCSSVLKGTFWGFDCDARKYAHTKINIKNAFHATGIHPSKPNAVLTQLPSTKSPDSLSFLSDRSLPSTSKQILRTPKTRQDL
ncbi:hypothetical protein C7212DRAFT_232868, partial [Tuber magnatum]